MPFLDDLALIRRPYLHGFDLQARTKDAIAGNARVLPWGADYELIELRVSPAYRDRHVAKLLYRQTLRIAIEQGRRLYSPVQRTPAAEGLARLLEQRGRARPVDTGQGLVGLVGYHPDNALFTDQQRANFPVPETTAEGWQVWPVRRWILDPDTTDVDTLSLDSPL